MYPTACPNAKRFPASSHLFPEVAGTVEASPATRGDLVQSVNDQDHRRRGAATRRCSSKRLGSQSIDNFGNRLPAHTRAHVSRSALIGRSVSSVVRSPRHSAYRSGMYLNRAVIDMGELVHASPAHAEKAGPTPDNAEAARSTTQLRADLPRATVFQKPRPIMLSALLRHTFRIGKCSRISTAHSLRGLSFDSGDAASRRT